MRRFLLALGFCAAASHPVAAEDLRISTGSNSGTYIQFGQQIADIAKEVAGLDVAVSTSQGSVENIKRVLGYDVGPDPDNPQFFQLAIIQEDVLADLRRHAQGSELLLDIVDKVKVVMPLYQEEVHLFVRAGDFVTELGDLETAFIAAGAPSSGSYVTTSLLLAMAGINTPSENLTPSGGEGALKNLANHAVDAVLQVAGAPSTLGASVSPDSGFGLATIVSPGVFAVGSPYKKAVITPEVYPWLKAPVDTVAVGSVLVAYDYEEGNENCEKIAKLTKAIVQSLDKLRETGHAKWSQVNPEAVLGRGEAMSACARRAFE